MIIISFFILVWLQLIIIIYHFIGAVTINYNIFFVIGAVTDNNFKNSFLYAQYSSRQPSSSKNGGKLDETIVTPQGTSKEEVEGGGRKEEPSDTGDEEEVGFVIKF